MYWLLTLMTMAILSVIALGLYLELAPNRAPRPSPTRLRWGLGTQIALFVVAEIALIALGTQEAMAAAEAAAGAAREISIGYGLALIGVGLPTAIAAIGAGIAVGPVGAAALAVVAEKPEAFGRSLVYLGLAEGIAIYGIVVSIIMLERI
jgi:V/A-type H+-transporting ATPase subunit K